MTVGCFVGASHINDPGLVVSPLLVWAVCLLVVSAPTEGWSVGAAVMLARELW